MMDQTRRSADGAAAELFAEAAERIQKGETLEQVVASYPTRYGPALRDLLTIVQMATDIHQADVPSLSAARRAARKAAFLQAAAAKRTEQVAVQAARPQVYEPAPPSLRERLAAVWVVLQDLFAVRTLRLAPFGLLLALLMLASTTVVSLAQSALPGDITYPVKQWIRHQQLYLVPVHERPAARARQEAELVADVLKVQEEKKAETTASAIEVEATLLYHGERGDYYNIGDLWVYNRYQPDPNVATYLPMAEVGELVPGQTVKVTYQIVTNAAGVRLPVVQGIRLVAIAAQPIEPTPVPLPEQADEPNVEGPCQVVVRDGWIPVTATNVGSIAELAARYRVSEEALRYVNCLFTEEPFGRSQILVPRPPDPVVVPTNTVDSATVLPAALTETPVIEFTETPVATVPDTPSAIETLPAATPGVPNTPGPSQPTAQETVDAGPTELGTDTTPDATASTPEPDGTADLTATAEATAKPETPEATTPEPATPGASSTAETVTPEVTEETPSPTIEATEADTPSAETATPTSPAAEATETAVSTAEATPVTGSKAPTPSPEPTLPSATEAPTMEPPIATPIPLPTDPPTPAPLPTDPPTPIPLPTDPPTPVPLPTDPPPVQEQPPVDQPPADETTP